MHYLKFLWITKYCFHKSLCLCCSIVYDIAERYNAIVILDDTHGTGVMGENLR